jgi:hypothetical protein
MNNPLESEELVDLSESKEKFASEFQDTYANAFLRVLAVVGLPLSAAIAYRVLTNSLPAYFCGCDFFGRDNNPRRFRSATTFYKAKNHSVNGTDYIHQPISSR